MYKMADTEDEVEKLSLLSSSESSMDDNSDNHDNNNNKKKKKNNGDHNNEAPSSCQSRLFTPRIIRITWSIANILLLGINVELIWFRNAMNETIHDNLPNETAVVIRTTAPPPQWNFSSSPSSGFVPYEKIFGHVHMAKTAGSEINGELAAHYERVCGHKG